MFSTGFIMTLKLHTLSLLESSGLFRYFTFKGCIDVSTFNTRVLCSDSASVSLFLTYSGDGCIQSDSCLDTGQG